MSSRSETTVKTKRTYLCQHCDAVYGDCIHTENHQTYPKEESGRIISSIEFLVLIEAGDI
jgi:hypothetical protein